MRSKVLYVFAALLMACFDCSAQSSSPADAGCSDNKTPTQVQSFQDLIVRTFREKQGGGCIQISRRGTVLYNSHTDGAYFLLNSTADKSVGGLGANPHALPIGTDLLSSGKPDILIMDWSMGAHCCATYEVVEIGDNARLAASIDGEDSDSSYFADLQHDGRYEFVGRDFTFAYWHSDFVHSAAPPRILRFDGKKYVLAMNLMKKPLPSPDALRNVKQEVKTGAWVDSYPPSILTSSMVNLIFTGHPNEAWSLASQSWVPGHVAESTFIQEFCTQLSLDQDYSQLRPMLIGAPCKLPDAKSL